MSDSPTLHDAQVLAAARRGERAAFEALVSACKADLYRLVRRYVGDADDAYDVLQEALVSAWFALPRFDPRLPFGPWVRTIALNKCRDFSRRRAVRQRLQRLFLLESGPPEDRSADPQGAQRGNDGTARLRVLDRAIAGLPRRYKEPLILTALQGMSQREAAALLGISPKAVEMRVHRARRKLRDTLEAAADPQA